MGRRRINYDLEDDGVNIFIKNINNNRLGGKITQLQRKIKRAKYFKKHSASEYINRYDRDPDSNGIVYDYVAKDGASKLTKKLNELMYCKALLDIVNAQDMISRGYMNYMSDLFEKEYVIVEEMNNKMDLEEYLDSIVGKKLFKEEQKELIERVDLRDYRNRLQKSFSTIESYLENNTKHRLIRDRETSKESINKYRKTYWKVVEV